MVELAARLASALTVFWDVRHRREGRDWLEAVLTSGAPLTPAVRAKTLHAAGWLARALYDRATGIALLEESLALYRALGDERGYTTTFFIAFALIGLSEVAQAAGDYARATALLEEALVHFGTLGDSHRMARVYAMLGQVALDGQDDASARSMAMQSVQLARSVDEPETISACLAGMADSAARQGKAIWAARLWGAAERQGDDPKHIAPQ